MFAAGSVKLECPQCGVVKNHPLISIAKAAGAKGLLLGWLDSVFWTFFRNPLA
jgi:hypothetical protein